MKRLAPRVRALWALYATFASWGAVFISRSSFLAANGKRYFCLFDDAMISMRYAWNLSHGAGLVWNRGEYVQGYTNLLMTLVMSLATSLAGKVLAPLLIQLSGLLVLCAVGYLSLLLADAIRPMEEEGTRPLVRALSLFCVLFCYPLAYWTLMGMETGLLALFLLLAMLCAFRYVDRPTPRGVFPTSMSLGFAYLARNDSLVLALLIWAYIALEVRAHSKDGAVPLRHLAAGVGLYSLFVVGQTIFQYTYYGDWMSNTYTLKLTGMSALARMRDGAGFIRPFLLEAALLIAVCIAGQLVAVDARRRRLLLFSIVLAAIGYQVFIGGDPWNYWRFLAPAMPVLLVLFVASAASCAKAFERAMAPGLAQGVALVLLTVAASQLANARFLREMVGLARPFQVDENERNVNTALSLLEVTTSSASVGVYWAGAIPYFTGRRAIDFLGKSDRYVARLPPWISSGVLWSGMRSVPGHNKFDLAYSIRGLRPTYVQGFQWGTEDLSAWAESRYRSVRYKGSELLLARDSPDVLWGKLVNP
jgi:arabinofuranosyltransferase